MTPIKASAGSTAQSTQGIFSPSKQPLPQEKTKTAPAAQNKKQDSVFISAAAREKAAADSPKNTFSNLSELDAWLRENFSAYQNGSVQVSRSFLSACLKDPEKLSSLEETLKAIPDIIEQMKSSLPKNARLISCSFSIDKNGGLSTSAQTSSVFFNAPKRAAELSGANTVTDVGFIAAKLKQDLAEVKAGGCDDETIAQINRLLRRAEEKLRQLQKQGDTPGCASFSLSAPAGAPNVAALFEANF
ncbi:MAG: hypothetical protein Q4G07_11445 [Oscillospiraceae bacterium]|nr:hypothetical protein [Oscillospiraceae bacterium]